MEPNYARAFRIVRAAYGLRQAELAERMDITPSQLSLVESGKRRPSLRTVEALAQAVGAPSALVTLLASSPSDVESQSASEVSDLARALLRVLVSAQGNPQERLDFKGGGG